MTQNQKTDRDSNPQLDWEQEGKVTGEGVNASLSAGLQTEGA